MGCDIHMMIEKKVASENVPEQWVTINTMATIHTDGLSRIEKGRHAWYAAEDRNYEYFGNLTNGEVRCEATDFHYPLRGVPDDVSPLVQLNLDYWMHDGHSHSWLYADEFIPVYMKHFMAPEEVTRLVELRMKGHEIWDELMSHHFNVAVGEEDEPTDFRFVFWFDN